jgi:NADH-quinone oxidoreductase subunit L
MRSFEGLWLIPIFPLLAAAVTALAPRRSRRLSAGLAIGAMVAALIWSILAFVSALQYAGLHPGMVQTQNFAWFQIGESWVRLGWLLDPLTAVMLVMVCLVGLLIFIYSVGYMVHDPNFGRFFCFLSLFAAAMLGLLISNSLLLLFICWELVGLTSYLLIGFWFQKPSAAAAAKKAFITTRIGDMAFLLGIVWLYNETGTLLFYDHGAGCLEAGALGDLLGGVTALGVTAATGIALLIFLGAVGKSGQFPLHVWLPDAMEGPTPVSALIHAATMVAAGVFLVARVYPLMAAVPVPVDAGTMTISAAATTDADRQTAGSVTGHHGQSSAPISTALKVVTWTGVLTALMAASIAVAQTDIKRILAYSTVSQLGFMMIGLGTGGVVVGMFHLITHAFFKALLFMGAGSVIHGCHEVQDIRRMGGLRRLMPVTFATYAVGMMALAGVPVFFSGFWSKDAILHAAHGWGPSGAPFYLGLVGALLTAFYMTRQMCYVFLGERREIAAKHGGAAAQMPHESPAVMTVPLVVLAVGAVLLGFFGTPAWPWFQSFVGGTTLVLSWEALFSAESLELMGLSAFVVFVGVALGWSWYGRMSTDTAVADPMRRARPDIYSLLENKFYVDEIYESTVVRAHQGWGKICVWADTWLWNGVVQASAYATLGLSWCSRVFDEYGLNFSFDRLCGGLRRGGGWTSRWQNGRVQFYLRFIGVGVALLALLLIWGFRA